MWFQGPFSHVVMSLCVKAEPLGRLYSERRSLHRSRTYFSVISQPSFNYAPFIFGIHLFSFSSSSVSALPWRMPMLCSLVLSISSFLLLQHISLLSINIRASESSLHVLTPQFSAWFHDEVNQVLNR